MSITFFPEEQSEESIWYFMAAWDSFILGPYRPYLMPILKGKYIKAIDYLTQGYQTKSSLGGSNKLCNTYYFGLLP